jgi:hypothetical protein
MVRGVCFVGLAGGFMVISPQLRDSLLGGYEAFNTALEQNAPISYVMLGATIFVIMLVYFSRGSAVR